MEPDRQSVNDDIDSEGNTNSSVNGKTCLVLHLYHSLVFVFNLDLLCVITCKSIFFLYIMLKFVLYCCLGGHHDNVMSLRETDWLTTVNNREISLVLLSTLSNVSCIRHSINANGEDVIHTLHIPCSIINHIKAELDYQIDLEFTKYVEPTVEYNYPNEY